MDLGLAVHNSGAASSRDRGRETLELVPFGKLLFSSDAYGLAELYPAGCRSSSATGLGGALAGPGGRRRA
jgi:hypothetical protein